MSLIMATSGSFRAIETEIRVAHCVKELVLFLPDFVICDALRLLSPLSVGETERPMILTCKQANKLSFGGLRHSLSFCRKSSFWKKAPHKRGGACN